jgi:hypothetical protein
VEAGKAVPARPRNWIDAVNSQVALQPLSVTAPAMMKAVPATPLDGPSSAGTYRVASAPSLRATGPAGRTGRPAGILTRAYRGQIGGLQGLFRWLNESAYLLSVPFLMLLIFGVLVHNHPLAILGATLVVVLNIGRLATGLANLVLIPFRESPLRGILFLIPPITILYCLLRWKRVKKPLRRIIEPALTIAAVALAFSFVPWLRGGKLEPSRDLKGQITEGAQQLESDIRQQLGTLPADFRKLPEKAGDFLKGPPSDATEGDPAVSPAKAPAPGPLERLKAAADQLKAIREGEP